MIILHIKLCDLRDDADLTEKDISNYLHIKQNTYSQYENANQQLPIALLIALAEYYHTSTDYILRPNDEKNHILKIKDTLLTESVMCLFYCLENDFPAYLADSSIATATATVIPTMGLLPAPIRPIISTSKAPMAALL